jgi:WD40 repeat protein
LTSSNDGTVAQWNVSTGQELSLALAHGDPGNRDAEIGPVTCMDLSPDGSRLLTVSEDGQGAARQSAIRLWDVDRAKLIHELYRGHENITSVVFAGANAALSVGFQGKGDAAGRVAEGSVVRRWNLDTRSEVTPVAGSPYLDWKGRQVAVWSALEAPEGAGILTVGGNGPVLWNPGSPDKPELVFKPHSSVTSASFSADGKLIVTGSSDHRAKIWNAKTGHVAFQLPAEHAKQINSALFSPVDNSVGKHLLVTASNDGTARIWEIPARRVLHVLQAEGPVEPVQYATFSPDGKSVATACEDGTVRYWETATGRATGLLKLDSSAHCVAYSVDGRRILVGCANGKATIFDVQTHEPLVQYSGHTAPILSVALSPDGRRALTGASDRLAKVWDTDIQGSGPAEPDPAKASVRTADSANILIGKEILTLKHHDRAVTSVAFSPDGRTILTAGLDGWAMLWLTDDWKQPLAKD